MKINEKYSINKISVLLKGQLKFPKGREKNKAVSKVYLKQFRIQTSMKSSLHWGQC